ncbi:MAG: hypothetical protein M1580_00970 [Candidatus Parvarchaeota archaeon]|nr:hypothetical protein [Candidatus Parvarchaeota archaeon]
MNRLVKEWKYVILASLAFLPLGYLGLQTPYEPVAFILGISDGFLGIIIILNSYEAGFTDGAKSTKAKSMTILKQTRLFWFKIIAIDLGVVSIVGLIFILTLNQATVLTNFDTFGLGIIALAILVIEFVSLRNSL